MSHIDDLIQDLCPEGVSFQPLGTLGRRNKGTAMTAARMREIDSGGPIRVFAGGNTVADVDETSVPVKAVVRQPSIIVKSRGHIGFTYYEGPFSHKNELWSYTLSDPVVNQKFVYYYLLTRTRDLQDLARATSVKLPQLSVRDTDALKVPVPPIEVQDEIVRILDTFSALTAELEAELEARRTQYEYYRYDLFRQLDPDGVPFRELKEVAKIRNGKNHKSFPSGPIPVYGTGGVMTSIDRAAHEGPSVLIPRKGSLNQLYFVEEPFWTVDTIFYTEIDETQVRPKFFYYYLKTQRLEELNQAGGIPSLTQKVLNRLRVPVPPFEVQNEVVRILDGFTELTAELEAEIQARRKQYEYYRDRLLTFEEVAR